MRLNRIHLSLDYQKAQVKASIGTKGAWSRIRQFARRELDSGSKLRPIPSLIAHSSHLNASNHIGADNDSDESSFHSWLTFSLKYEELSQYE